MFNVKKLDILVLSSLSFTSTGLPWSPIYLKKGAPYSLVSIFILYFKPKTDMGKANKNKTSTKTGQQRP